MQHSETSQLDCSFSIYVLVPIEIIDRHDFLCWFQSVLKTVVISVTNDAFLATTQPQIPTVKLCCNCGFFYMRWNPKPQQNNTFSYIKKKHLF